MQESVLQCSDSAFGPTQGAPVPTGAGLSHTLVCSLVPVLQVFEQLPHKLHSDQPPSTNQKKKNVKYC